MSGRNRTRRGRGGSGRTSGWTGQALWVAGGLLLLALLVVPTLGFGSDRHPEPREHIGHDHVAPAARYAAYPRVAQTYSQAAAVPHIIDGIYCYCECSNHSGHYSLLDCFHDDHAARCDVCLSEAALAYRMHHAGKSLDEIRTAIDQLYDT